MEVRTMTRTIRAGAFAVLLALAPLAAQRPASPLISGDRRLIVLNLRSSETGPASSNASLEETVFTASNSVAAYYREVSGGLTTFTGIVSGPHVVSAKECNTSRWASEADAAATAAGVKLSAYQHRIYVMPQESINLCAGWGAISQLNGSRVWVLGYPEMTLSARIYSHELGHNIGLSHAASPFWDYGDTSDTMGGKENPVMHPHFNAPHKVQLGWLSDTQIQTVSAGGTYTLDALVPVSTGIKTYRVPVPGSTDFYYVSYRTAVGVFDSLLPARYVDRTSIHRFSGSGMPMLLANLADGEWYWESGVLFTQVSHTADSARVTIALAAPQPPPPPPAPDTIAPSQVRQGIPEILGSEVRITWRTGVDDVGVAGYELYRNGVLLATTASTNHTDTSARTGVTYTYRVRVFDAAGNFSDLSNPRSILR